MYYNSKRHNCSFLLTSSSNCFLAASTIHLSSNGDERHNMPDPSSDMQGPDYGFPQSHHLGPHQNDFYNIDTDSDSNGF